mmetsp:Transcript_14725/g.41683  ORF Transcript_14725/g.41683 Transcript_14725/m.41683 type:complete len:148 (+) Transcript_14725:716-1159(+)
MLEAIEAIGAIERLGAETSETATPLGDMSHSTLVPETSRTKRSRGAVRLFVIPIDSWDAISEGLGSERVFAAMTEPRARPAARGEAMLISSGVNIVRRGKSGACEMCLGEAPATAGKPGGCTTDLRGVGAVDLRCAILFTASASTSG